MQRRHTFICAQDFMRFIPGCRRITKNLKLTIANIHNPIFRNEVFRVQLRFIGAIERQAGLGHFHDEERGSGMGLHIIQRLTGDHCQIRLGF